MSLEVPADRAVTSTPVTSPNVSQAIISEATASRPKVAPSANFIGATEAHSIGALSEELSIQPVRRFRKLISRFNITSDEERSLLLKAVDELIAQQQVPNPDSDQDVTLTVESAEPPVVQQRKARTNGGRALIFLSVCLVVGLFVSAGLAIYYYYSRSEGGEKASFLIWGPGTSNIDFRASVSKIKPIVTPYLSFTCRLTSMPAGLWVSSIEIRKRGVAWGLAQLWHSGAWVPAPGYNHAKAIGDANEGYLTLNLTYPKQSDTGSYYCEIRTREEGVRPSTVLYSSKSVNIGEIQLTRNDMIEIIREQRIKVSILETKVATLETKVASQESERDQGPN